MIINSGLTARMIVPESQLDTDRHTLEAEIVNQLDASAKSMGARTTGLNVETYVQTECPEPGSVYLAARYTGLDTGEIIGGHHDGVVIPVDRRAAKVRLVIDRGSQATPTDDNSLWYERRGVSDNTGHWAYVPVDR